MHVGCHLNILATRLKAHLRNPIIASPQLKALLGRQKAMVGSHLHLPNMEMLYHQFLAVMAVRIQKWCLGDLHRARDIPADLHQERQKSNWTGGLDRSEE